MTAKVAIVTDSAACLTPEMAASHNIEVVPIHIVFGDKVYRDGVEISPSQFYEKLSQTDAIPTTGAPPPTEFLEAFSRASQRAPTVLCLTLTARFSGVFNVANVARDLAREKMPGVAIEVVDSQQAVGAQALIVMAAARAAQAGGDLPAVKQAAENMVDRAYTYTLLDTMRFMARQGRVPKISAMAASLLRIKPILATEKNGNTYPVSRPRTIKVAMEELLSIMVQKTHGRPLHVVVMHAGAPERGAWLHQQIQQRFNVAEIFVTEFSPVTGAHTGPGLAGFSFYEDN